VDLELGPDRDVWISTSVRTGMLDASSTKARVSARVTFATLRIDRSHQRCSYGSSGIRSRWMALMATVAPRSSARSAATTTEPTGANVTAASRGAGARSSYRPVQAAPRAAARSRSRADRDQT
jgi:hypothetical protein